MTAPVYLLDGSTIGQYFSGGNNAGLAYLQWLADLNKSGQIQIVLVDRVRTELSTSPMSDAVRDWIAKNGITPVETPTGIGVANGTITNTTDSGEKAILDVIEGRTSYDMTGKTYNIITDDLSFFKTGQPGAAYRSSLLTTQDIAASLLRGGYFGVEDYLDFSIRKATLNSTNGVTPWMDKYQAFNASPIGQKGWIADPVTGEATSPEGIKTSLSTVLGKYYGDQSGSFDIAIIGNKLGLNSGDLGTTIVGGAGSALVMAGAAAMAYDITSSFETAKKQYAAGNYAGAAQTLNAAAMRAGLGVAGAELGAWLATGAAGLLAVAGITLSAPAVAAAALISAAAGAIILASGGSEVGAILTRAETSAIETLASVLRPYLPNGQMFSLDNIFGGGQLDTSFFNSLFNTASYASPLILDLDGNSTVDTISKRSGTYFDLDHNGFAQRTGWVGGNDGILVWDRNGNGKIDDGSEMFGDNALKANGTVAANGFEILQSYDTNGDGKINSADALWNNLKLWVDANHNGLTDAGELKSLASQNVQSLNVTGTNNGFSPDANGNQMRLLGSYTKTDGSTASMNDVFFSTDPADAVANTYITESAAITALPDLPGSGNVYTLHQAMVRDSSGTLQTLVSQFASLTDPTARTNLLTQIIYAWAGVTALDPNSRNSNGAGIDARKLAALEAFLGRQYTQYDTSNSPHDPAYAAGGAAVNASYQALSERLYAQLMAETILKPFYDLVKPVWNSAGMHFDYSAALTALFNPATPEATRHANVLEFYRTIFASETSPDTTDFNGLITAASQQVPQYMTEINQITQPYYQGKYLQAEYYDGATVSGTLGNDTITSIAPSGVTMYGYDGNDTLQGYYGADILYGGNGNDVITGGPDADQLYGGNGDDTIIVNYGDVAAGEIIDGGTGVNTLKVNSTADISGATISNIQILDISSGNGAILTGAQLAGFSSITNGSTTMQLSLQAVAGGGAYDVTGKTVTSVYFYGSTGDDNFTGSSGNDNIFGNTGNDTLNGMGGDDLIYANYGGVQKLYGGDGNDTINVGASLATGSVIDGGNGTDTLSMNASYVDISSAALSNIETLGLNYATVLLTSTQIAGLSSITSSSGTIQAASAGTYDISGKTNTGIVNLTGSTGDDILTGDASSQGINGGGGNDTLYGGGGDDYLNGDSGDNVLHGGDGNDTLLSYYPGIEKLYGDAGNDTFIISPDPSAGSIIDGGTGTNTLSVSNANISNAAISNIQVLSIGSYVALNATQLAGFTSITTGNAVIAAVSAGTYDLSGKTITGIVNLSGSTGNDVLTGDASSQGINGGDGNDTIYGGGGDDYLNGDAGDNVLHGGDGNDTLLSYYSGIEQLYGDAGNDTIILGPSPLAGSIIDGGTGSNTLNVTNIDISATTITNIQTLSISSAVTLTAAQLTGFSSLTGNGLIYAASAGTYNLGTKAGTTSFSIYGSVGNDVLTGDANVQTLSGGDGDDTLTGGAGADTLLGGNGNDTIVVAAGDVVAGESIDGGAGTNKLVATSADISAGTISNMQTLQISGTVTLTAAELTAFTSLTGSGTLAASAAGTYSLGTKAGTNIINLTGSSGNDTLTGDANAQTLTGGAGNDTLSGLDGNDTLSGGAGADNIAGGNGNDTILVGTGDVVTGEVIDGGTGTNTLIATAADISAGTISNVQTLQVSGSATLTAAQLTAFTSLTGSGTLTASAAGAYSLGTKAGTNVFNLTGSSGNDTLTGDGNSQTLSGGAGNDTLNGLAGNDTLDGGAGTDVLVGGTGNDTYKFGLGYGSDSITENDSTAGNTDILSFASGTARDQIWFTHTGNDLVLQIIGTTDKMTVSGWYSVGTAAHVEQIKTAAGNVLLDTKVQNLVNAMAGLTIPSTTTMSAAYHTQLDPVIAANWT